MDSSIAPRKGSKRADQGRGDNSATKHAASKRISSGSGKVIRDRDDKSMVNRGASSGRYSRGL